MKILYVTSFSKPLFDMSGQFMLESFLKHNIGDILVCYESFDFESIANKLLQFPLKYTNIMEYPYLKKWIQKNKDVIPTVFGGEMPDPNDKKHNNIKLQKKVYNYWNKKASLWFRKIAALHFAMETYQDYDAIIWVDCDCIFKKNLPNSLIEKLFEKFDVFYHQGEFRNSKDFGFETGFIGFKKNKGFDIIKLVSNMYKSEQYRKLNRWDDGYVFRVIIQQMIKDKSIVAVDLVDSNKPGKRLEAINKGLFSEYLVHHKGSHKALPNMGEYKKK